MVEERQKILVVEDEGPLAQEMVRVLRSTGYYEVDLEMDGARAAERIPAENPDLVLLDLGLPGKDGLEVIQEVHGKYSGPIVIVTGKSELEVHALGLRSGASDFLKKPFNKDILLAHVECRLRERHRVEKGVTAEQGGISGKRPVLRIDMVSRVATLDGRDLRLTASEIDLLAILAARPGELVSMSELGERLRSVGVDATWKSLEMAVCRIRAKVGDIGIGILQNVRKRGYLLAPGIDVQIVPK